MSRNRIVLVVALVLVAMAAVVPACASIEAQRQQIQDSRDDLIGLKSTLEQRAAALERAISDPSAPPDLRAGWEMQLRLTRDQIATSQQAIDASLQYEQDPAGGAITRTVGAVAPFVPEPYRLPLVLGAGLAASLARGVQLRRAGRAIASGVQAALDADPTLAAGFEKQKALVASKQPALARRLVDEAQGKRPARPI